MELSLNMLPMAEPVSGNVGAGDSGKPDAPDAAALEAAGQFSNLLNQAMQPVQKNSGSQAPGQIQDRAAGSGSPADSEGEAQAATEGAITETAVATTAPAQTGTGLTGAESLLSQLKLALIQTTGIPAPAPQSDAPAAPATPDLTVTTTPDAPAADTAETIPAQAAPQASASPSANAATDAAVALATAATLATIVPGQTQASPETEPAATDNAPVSQDAEPQTKSTEPAPQAAAQPAAVAPQALDLLLLASLSQSSIGAAPIQIPAAPQAPDTPAAQANAGIETAASIPVANLLPAPAKSARPAAAQNTQDFQSGLSATDGKNTLPTPDAIAPDFTQSAPQTQAAPATDSLPLPPPTVLETGARFDAGAGSNTIPTGVVADAGNASEQAETAVPHVAVEKSEQPAAKDGHKSTADLEKLIAPHAETLHAEIIMTADTTAPVVTTPDAAASATAVQSVSATHASATSQASESAPTQASTPVFTATADTLTDQIVEGTAFTAKGGHRELTIKLNPVHLGEVRVNLISRQVGDGTELSARLIATTPETHEALQQQAHQLRDSLEAQGIKVDRIHVVLASSAGEGSRNDSQGSRDAGQNFNRDQQQQSSLSQQQQQQRDAQDSAFQMAGQGNPQARPQASNHYASRPGTAGVGAVQPSETSAPRQANDNGSISILA